MDSIQYPRAVPCEYNDVQFRSKLEARWAVFMDHLDVLWSYESAGFSLQCKGGQIIKYLPDFRVVEGDILWWLEVKGAKPSSMELLRCRLLSQGTLEPAVLVSGGFVGDKPESFVFTGHPDSNMEKVWDQYVCHIPHLDDTLILKWFIGGKLTHDQVDAVSAAYLMGSVATFKRIRRAPGRRKGKLRRIVLEDGQPPLTMDDKCPNCGVEGYISINGTKCILCGHTLLT